MSVHAGSAKAMGRATAKHGRAIVFVAPPAVDPARPWAVGEGEVVRHTVNAIAIPLGYGDVRETVGELHAQTTRVYLIDGRFAPSTQMTVADPDDQEEGRAEVRVDIVGVTPIKPGVTAIGYYVQARR